MSDSLSKKCIYALLFGYLMFSPVYLFPSGLPQPADFMLVLAVLIWLGRARYIIHRELRWFLFAGLVFVINALLVSVLWTIYLQDFDTIRGGIFYLYNFFAVLLFCSMFSEDRENTLKIFSRGLFAGISVAFISQILLFDPLAARQTGFFNNPNQLGYFGLLATCGLLVCARIKALGSVASSIGVTFGVVVTLMSFSLTAIGALGFVFIAYMAFFLKSRQSVMVTTLLIALPVVGLGLYGMPDRAEYFVDRSQARIAVIDEKTDNAAQQRGYHRLVEYPEYVLFGAAERGFWRFGQGHTSEIHSTPATALFSYGVIGLTSFLAMLVLAGRRGEFGYWMLIAAPLAYSMTHMGLRFTLFWLLIALIASVTVRDLSRPVIQKSGETKLKPAFKTAGV